MSEWQSVNRCTVLCYAEAGGREGEQRRDLELNVRETRRVRKGNGGDGADGGWRIVRAAGVNTVL